MRASETNVVFAAALALGTAACVPLVHGNPRCGEDKHCAMPMDAGHPDAAHSDAEAPHDAGSMPRRADASEAGADDAGKRDADSGARDAGSSERDAGEGESDAGAVESDAGACAAYPRISNVLVLAYDPILANGKSLHMDMGVEDARHLSALLAARLRDASGELIHYHIAEVKIVQGWPPQLPGKPVVDEDVWEHGVPAPGTGELGNADYAAMFEQASVCESVRVHDISEVWLWGFNNRANVGSGFDMYPYVLADGYPAAATDAELFMIGQRRRNIPTCSDRTLWLLGADATVEVSWAMGLYARRIEEVLGWALHVAASDPAEATARWSEFSRYELLGQGVANVGTSGHPPNDGLQTVASTDLTFGNHSPVESGAWRWAHYPDLGGDAQSIDCTAWGCTSEGYQHWYARHLPHNDGPSPNGTCNNWWKHLTDREGKLTPCHGADCRHRTGLGLPCIEDADCASNHCVCQTVAVDGSIIKPSWAACAEQPGKACGRPEGAGCALDSDCQFGHCGCHDNSRVCIFDPTIPAHCEDAPH